MKLSHSWIARNIRSKIMEEIADQVGHIMWSLEQHYYNLGQHSPKELPAVMETF